MRGTVPSKSSRPRSTGSACASMRSRRPPRGSASKSSSHPTERSAVQSDLERSTSKLYPDRLSKQPEGSCHSGLPPLGPRARTDERASSRLRDLQHRLRRGVGGHSGGSRGPRREEEAAEDPARLRWLVDGLDVGDDRSLRLSATEVPTTTGSRSRDLIRPLTRPSKSHRHPTRTSSRWPVRPRSGQWDARGSPPTGWSGRLRAVTVLPLWDGSRPSPFATSTATAWRSSTSGTTEPEKSLPPVRVSCPGRVRGGRLELARLRGAGAHRQPPTGATARHVVARALLGQEAGSPARLPRRARRWWRC